MSESENQRQELITWLNDQPDKNKALLPQNLSNEILDILVDDTKEMYSNKNEVDMKAGATITFTTLLLKSQIEQSTSLDIEPEQLGQYIACYAQALNLEGLRRKGVLSYSPEPTLENIFEDEKREFELTELGRQLEKELVTPH